MLDYNVPLPGAHEIAPVPSYLGPFWFGGGDIGVPTQFVVTPSPRSRFHALEALCSKRIR